MRGEVVDHHSVSSRAQASRCAHVGAVIVEYGDSAGASALAATLTHAGIAPVVIVSTGRVHAMEGAPDTRVIHLPENPGYGVAANAGERALPEGTTHFFLCNPDLHVERDQLQALCRQAEALDAGSVSPRLRDAAGAIEWDGGFIDFERVRIVHERMHESRGLDGAPRRVPFWIGACVLIRRDAWRDVGGMPEDLFLYFEDTDLCMRLAERGWHSYLVPSIEVGHARSSAVGMLSALQLYLMTRNGIRFFRRWGGSARSRTLSFVMHPARMARRALGARSGRPRLLGWVLLGAWDARRTSRWHSGKGRAARLVSGSAS